ncbi:unnamed protein product [Urochloa decumbens]|uniref:RBR-type E3 ubiquitin transferase n=1 Tax=Urochloa decumbens TaxID=240449 RepID=A0ABC9FE12_9POAL
MARKGKDDDYYYCGADDDDDYYSTEEDNATESDSEYGGGGASDDGDEQAENAEVIDDEDIRASAKDRDSGYDFVTEDDVRRRQDKVTSEISEVLSVPPGFAAALLRHCRWDPELLKNEWFSDEARVRAAVGLAPAGQPGGDVPTALNEVPLACAICFDGHGPGGMRSAGCRSHFYCHECWRGYIRAAVGDGARCLLLRCPDPKCPAPVVRELVDAAAAGEDRARYETFVVRSYVEEGTSRYVRWCTGPGCTLAVRAHEGSSRLSEVTCECGHLMCFRCGSDGHRPTPCETARAWAERCAADGDTTSWVLENTKHCPKCRRAIEKNQGCNHMTCGAPCRHQFCWLCLGAWDNHDGDNFNCNRYNASREEFVGDESKERQARASMVRFLHYYERWTTHGESMDRARKELAGELLEGFAAAMGVQPTDLGFLEEAYEQVIEARRVLRWTYAHIYGMDPDRDDIEFCEFLQGQAEGSLERLHKCAERERKELEDEIGHYWAASPSAYAAEKYVEFKQNLSNLNIVTKRHFAKLVEVYEPDVVS